MGDRRGKARQLSQREQEGDKEEDEEEDEGDEEEREALIARTRKRIPAPRVFPSAAKPPSAATGPRRFDVNGSA